MSSRHGDIIINICQKNDEERLLVESADSGIENVIGYESDELVGRDLKEILLPSVVEILDSYLDYDNDNNDLASVLSKVRDFGFVTKLGYEIKLNMRINRSLTKDNDPRFDIILKDHSEISEGSKSALRNFRGRQVIDRDMGLPDRESFMKEAEFINFCVNRERLLASFAIISIDGIENFKEQYGAEGRSALIKELVSRCRTNFREDDILGAIGDGQIGVLLLDAQTSVAKIPLNRLRWQIASQPLNVLGNEEINSTLSIAYCSVEKNRFVDKAIDVCQKKINSLKKSGGNKIAEVS